jgi:phosphoglucomutase
MAFQNSELEFKNIKNDVQMEINSFLKNEFKLFIDDQEILKKIDNITNQTIKNLQLWMSENIPKKYKKIILKNIYDKNWSEIIEAFKQELTFGTSGIRGKLISSLNEQKSNLDLVNLKDFGFESEILRGPNTVNEITLLKNIHGLIMYMKNNGMSKIVIGFDSRVLSKLLSSLISNLFIKNNFDILLFDSPNSMPELSFTVVDSKSDMGIEITASHNDKRYNGYKLITKHGGPPSAEIRDQIAKFILNNKMNLSYDLISKTTHNSISNSNKVVILKKSKELISNFAIENSNQNYLPHIEQLIFNKKNIKNFSSKIKIGYSALHGTGYDPISELLQCLKIQNVQYVKQMIYPNPLFPMFNSKQILDPSDRKTASIVVNEFINQYGYDDFSKLDMLAYTDPDADRLGIIVKTLTEEEFIYGKWRILHANDTWLLLLWYILEIIPKTNSQFSNFDKFFIVKSFVTSDALLYIAKKYNLECIDGKVGFSDLAKIVEEKWNNNKINIGIFEESCGFGLAGNPNLLKLHILEKDGILSMALILEIISYVKSHNLSLQDLLNKLYLDNEIGFFSTFRRELPENGIFEGIHDEFLMEKYLKNVEIFYLKVQKSIQNKNPIKICGLAITNVQRFSTGKHDLKFWKDFPDEGIRFFLNSNVNHITIRPSGTEPKIRIFVQYRINDINKNNLLEKKSFAENLTHTLSYEIEKLIPLS